MNTLDTTAFEAWLEEQPTEVKLVVNRHVEVLCEKVEHLGLKGARQLLSKIYLLVWARTPREEVEYA